MAGFSWITFNGAMEVPHHKEVFVLCKKMAILEEWVLKASWVYHIKLFSFGNRTGRWEHSIS